MAFVWSPNCSFCKTNGLVSRRVVCSRNGWSPLPDNKSDPKGKLARFLSFQTLNLIKFANRPKNSNLALWWGDQFVRRDGTVSARLLDFCIHNCASVRACCENSSLLPQKWRNKLCDFESGGLCNLISVFSQLYSANRAHRCTFAAMMQDKSVSSA